MIWKRYKLKNFNFLLLILVIVSMLTGILIINGVDSSLTMKQSVGAGVSLVLILLLSLIDYHIYAGFYMILYLISTILLVAVLLFGDSSNNATRWFTIGNVTFQPSELTKIIMIIFMATLLGKEMEEDRVNTFRGIFSFLIFLLIPVVLIYLQPDLSTTICLILVMLTLLFMAGISYKTMGITLLVLIPLISIFLWYVQQPDQKLLYAHQVERILSFLYPSQYPDPQQDNSVMAIGSGQLTGKGLIGAAGSSALDTNMISEQQTDFIFSAIGESFGFVGSAIIVGIIFLIVLQCIRIGRRAKDDTGRLLATGVGCLIGYQSFINIGVATQVLPNTGIPLPFFSYGLSSLISTAIGIGIVLNVGLQKRKY